MHPLNPLSDNAPWLTLLYHFTLSNTRWFYWSREETRVVAMVVTLNGLIWKFFCLRWNCSWRRSSDRSREERAWKDVGRRLGTLKICCELYYVFVFDSTMYLMFFFRIHSTWKSTLARGEQKWIPQKFPRCPMNVSLAAYVSTCILDVPILKTLILRAILRAQICTILLCYVQKTWALWSIGVEFWFCPGGLKVQTHDRLLLNRENRILVGIICRSFEVIEIHNVVCENRIRIM